MQHTNWLPITPFEKEGTVPINRFMEGELALQGYLNSPILGWHKFELQVSQKVSPGENGGRIDQERSK